MPRAGMVPDDDLYIFLQCHIFLFIVIYIWRCLESSNHYFLSARSTAWLSKKKVWKRLRFWLLKGMSLIVPPVRRPAVQASAVLTPSAEQPKQLIQTLSRPKGLDNALFFFVSLRP